MKKSRAVVNLLAGLFFSPDIFAVEKGLSGEHMLQIGGGLMLVLVIIFFAAWIAKRLRFGMAPANQQLIKILSYLPLGTRDRILLIQIGDEQILVASGNQGIQKLHKLETPIAVDDLPKNDGGSFQSVLQKLIKGNEKGGQK